MNKNQKIIIIVLAIIIAMAVLVTKPYWEGHTNKMVSYVEKKYGIKVEVAEYEKRAGHSGNGFKQVHTALLKTKDTGIYFTIFNKVNYKGDEPYQDNYNAMKLSYEYTNKYGNNIEQMQTRNSKVIFTIEPGYYTQDNGERVPYKFNGLAEMEGNPDKVSRVFTRVIINEKDRKDLTYEADLLYKWYKFTEGNQIEQQIITVSYVKDDVYQEIINNPYYHLMSNSSIASEKRYDIVDNEIHYYYSKGDKKVISAKEFEGIVSNKLKSYEEEKTN